MTGTFSENDEQTDSLDTIIDRYMRALQGYGGPACKYNFVQGALNDPNVQPGVGACQYWNPFASRLLAQPGDPTYNSPELADWMTYGGTTIGRARFTSLEWVTTGDLWEMGGGATGLAIGAQFRNQDLHIGVDPISKDGGFGFTPQILRDWDSQRDTTSVFAELVMYPSDKFELDLAARYEDTLGQSSTEPKVSMLWTPTEQALFPGYGRLVVPARQREPALSASDRAVSRAARSAVRSPRRPVSPWVIRTSSRRRRTTGPWASRMTSRITSRSS